MSRTKEAVFMGIGILAGLALSGPAAQAAEAALTARPTTQTFYVGGTRVEFEAYQIHGNNFVKLRDIGKTVGFGVTYDAATNTVHIAPDAPYIEEVTTPAPAAPSPQAVTAESVQAILAQLKQTFAGQAVSNYHEIMAGAVLAVLPLVILFMLFQKYMMTGYSKAAMK